MMQHLKRIHIALFVFLIAGAPAAFSQTETPVVFTRDKLQLVGILHLPTKANAKSPAVLMLHGFTGHKSETHFMYARLARILAGQGIATLRFDFAGSGDSQGDFADMTIKTELADARAAIRFLRKQKQIDSHRIGLLGFSMGGCVAALLAGENPDLKALVLWAPVAHPEENFKRLLAAAQSKSADGKQVVDVNGLPVGLPFLDTLPYAQPLPAIAEFTAPSLIIQGNNDQSVPLSAGKEYAKVLAEKNPASRLEVIENGDHVFASLEMVSRVLTLTSDWFKKYL
jgi:uncharacterized protein